MSFLHADLLPNMSLYPQPRAYLPLTQISVPVTCLITNYNGQRSSEEPWFSRSRTSLPPWHASVCSTARCLSFWIPDILCPAPRLESRREHQWCNSGTTVHDSFSCRAWNDVPLPTPSPWARCAIFFQTSNTPDVRKNRLSAVSSIHACYWQWTAS